MKSVLLMLCFSLQTSGCSCAADIKLQLCSQLLQSRIRWTLSFFEIISSFFEDVLLIAIKRENMELQGFLTLLGAG